MPTCRDVITRALRKIRVYAAGETPSNEDINDGLDELQNLYEQWGSNGMFGRLNDVQTDVDYEAEENERIRVTDGATVTIPTELTVLDEEERPPYDTAFIEVIDVAASTITRHLYDAGQGAWIEIGGLGLNDEAPLASKGRGGLAACLAVALAEEFGEPAGPAVLRQAASFKTGLALKLGSSAPRTAPDYF